MHFVWQWRIFFFLSYYFYYISHLNICADSIILCTHTAHTLHTHCTHAAHTLRTLHTICNDLRRLAARRYCVKFCLLTSEDGHNIKREADPTVHIKDIRDNLSSCSFGMKRYLTTAWRNRNKISPGEKQHSFLFVQHTEFVHHIILTSSLRQSVSLSPGRCCE